MTENLPRGSFARGGEGVPGILIFRIIIIIIIIFLFLYPHYANLNRILCALRQSTANEAAVQLQRRPAQERARNGIQNPVNGAPTLFRIIIIIIIIIILLHLHTRLHIFSISCPAVLDDLTEIFQILLQHYADFSRLQSAASVWRCASVRSHKCLDHQVANIAPAIK